MTAQRRSDALRFGLRPPLRAPERRCYTSPGDTTPPEKLICKENGIDVANGVGIFPLIILTMASFSSFTLQKLLEANKLILSVAGFVALMAILDD